MELNIAKFYCFFVALSFTFLQVLGQGACPNAEEPSCFNKVATWVSRYNHHGSPEEIQEAFQKLKDEGITWIYYNVWANGIVYFESSTARSMNVTVIDRLEWASTAARNLGLKLVAWFEYGNMANYEKLSSFGESAAKLNWLLMNGDSYHGDGQGLWIYMDISLHGVKEFISNLMIEALSYDIDGVQLDDHFIFPNGFDKTDKLSNYEKIMVTYNAMYDIGRKVKQMYPDKMFSYSPAPIHYSLPNQNIDWSIFLMMENGPDEIIPQYYRTSYQYFLNALNSDFEILPDDVKSSIIPGLRLSGGQTPKKTPCADVAKMIEECSKRNLPSVAFWFADDFLDETFVGLDKLFSVC